jgi:hypothetical protein
MKGLIYGRLSNLLLYYWTQDKLHSFFLRNRKIISYDIQENAFFRNRNAATMSLLFLILNNTFLILPSLCFAFCNSSNYSKLPLRQLNKQYTFFTPIQLTAA